MHAELALLLAGGVLVGLWSWAGHGRERVDEVSNRLCDELGIQRLDQSIALTRIGLSREYGALALVRVYRFEFSVTGAERRRGEVCLVNERARWARIDHPDGALHVEL